MNVALFLVTHEGIASNLIAVGEAIIQKTNNNLSYYEVAMDSDVTMALKNIEAELTRLNTDDGLVFITDIYGSTPSNIAQILAKKYRGDLISGVNLPMIIRLLNYRNEATDLLIKKALDGSRKAIQHNFPAS